MFFFLLVPDHYRLRRSIFQHRSSYVQTDAPNEEEWNCAVIERGKYTNN